MGFAFFQFFSTFCFPTYSRVMQIRNFFKSQIPVQGVKLGIFPSPRAVLKMRFVDARDHWEDPHCCTPPQIHLKKHAQLKVFISPRWKKNNFRTSNKYHY